MKSTKVNDNNDSIWQTASMLLLIGTYDSITFGELVIVVRCFQQIKLHQKKFFRFCALKNFFDT